jgi:hypothetical protein
MDDQVLITACLPGLPHAAYRLYALLAGVAHQRNARHAYFPVTLTGLQRIHPGTSGRAVASRTLVKQITELRKFNLIDVRAALDPNRPDLPVLVKVLGPDSDSWKAADGSALTLGELSAVAETQ